LMIIARLTVCFNPRARGGRDSGELGEAMSKPFQSTRPRGARLTTCNSADPDCVSIHAPAGGATLLPQV